MEWLGVSKRSARRDLKRVNEISRRDKLNRKTSREILCREIYLAERFIGIGILIPCLREYRFLHRRTAKKLRTC